jgi:hypothetical protein
MRVKLLLAAVLALMVVFGHASVASAEDSNVQFTVGAGALGISVPGSADLGSGDPGTTISAQLGAVTVTDARAGLTASWTASVSSTAFTTGGATTAETIANSAVQYWSGPATATSGTGTFTPGQAAAGNAVTLAAQRTAFSLANGVGNNTAAWNPTLAINVPAAAVGGTYEGTVTHTVL